MKKVAFGIILGIFSMGFGGYAKASDDAVCPYGPNPGPPVGVYPPYCPPIYTVPAPAPGPIEIPQSVIDAINAVTTIYGIMGGYPGVPFIPGPIDIGPFVAP